MNSPVKFDVGAKAEAKLALSGEVPSSSLGRFLDSLTDIFRPFSESRGLRADHIKLQREEIAIEVARRARQRLEIENAPLQPVDNKILIPLIEKSSLENPNDEEMIQKWSDLLANASKGEPVEPRYVQILSELTSRQAILFDKVARYAFERFDNPERWLEDAPAHLDPTYIRRHINELFVARKTPPSADYIYEKVLEVIDYPGCAIVDLLLYRPDGTDYGLFEERAQIERYHNFELDLEILGSLGLTRKAQVFYTTKFKDEIHLVYYYVTELGVAFFNSVKQLGG